MIPDRMFFFDACAEGALANLAKLYLGNTKIGDDSVIALADVIKPAAKGGKGPLANLNTLYLSDNKIGDDGVIALADACAFSFRTACC